VYWQNFSDEFPYAVSNEPSLPSELQHIWDHLFQHKPFMLVVAGSHISNQAPKECPQGRPAALILVIVK
jgi:hypothetical protein